MTNRFIGNCRIFGGRLWLSGCFMARKLIILYVLFVCALVVLGTERPACGKEAEFLEMGYFSRREFTDKPLKIYCPDTRGIPAPLVVHVCGENFDDPFPEKLIDFARSRGWILMKVKGLNGPYTYGVDEFEQALHAVCGRYNVDLDRIYLVGWNAWGVLRCAFRSPDRYAAVGASSPYTDFSTYYHRFYGDASTPLLPSYQRTIFANASTRTLIKNAQHLPTLLMINPLDPDWAQKETEKMVELFDLNQRKAVYSGTYTYETMRDSGGENAVLAAYRFFEGKSRVKNPQTLSLVAHTLHNPRAYWGEIIELGSSYSPGILEVASSKNTMMIRVEKVKAFRLHLSAKTAKNWGLDLQRPIRFIINNALVVSAPIGMMTFDLIQKEGSLVWVEEKPEGSPVSTVLKKTCDNPGWISPLASYTITYGTVGTPVENERNKTLAYTLAESYNTYFGAKRSPVADTSFSLTRLDQISENLILIGSSDSHSIFRELADRFPFEISRERVRILSETYPGNFPVAVTYPNPLKPSLSLLFLNRLGPGLNPWPHSWDTVMWAWPDYLIFRPQPEEVTVSPYKKGLYAMVAEGGFFPVDWNCSKVGREIIAADEKEIRPDTTPPEVVEWFPSPDSHDVPIRPQIMVNLGDSGSGVDDESVSMFLDNREIIPQISGNQELLVLTYTPKYDFSFGKKVRLEISAWDLASPPNEMQEEIIFTIKPETLYQLRVNCGGSEWQDPEGNVWLRDQAYTRERGWGYIGGYVFRTSSRNQIKGTDLDRIYHSIRRGWDFAGYRFDVENRTYRIRLHFSEILFKTTDCPKPSRSCYPAYLCTNGNCRTFAVSVEGATLVENFNVLAEVGSHYVSTTLGVVTDVTDGRIDIGLEAISEKPMISAIEIISVGQEEIYDETPPDISGWNPWQDAAEVSTDTGILVSITDDEAGVDLNSIVMIVNGKEVAPEIVGDPYRYNLYWTPSAPFEYGEKVTVFIGASDMAELPNRINGINSFFIESEVEAE